MKEDLISIKDLDAKDIKDLFLLARALKQNKQKYASVLKGKTLALVFQKPSNRTRVSFEVGMYQLGGNAIYLSPQEINLGVRESIADVARTLSRYIDGIVIRTFEHKNVIEMAKYADAPVINGLSDFSHPCQGLADVFTIGEKLKSFKGKTLAYVGDGNNVCHSLLYASAICGLNMRVGVPQGYEPSAAVVSEATRIAGKSSSFIYLCHDARDAVNNADVIYTDVWTSMGQEKEAAERKKIFEGFQVNAALLASAKKNVLVMHCLPAHRGEEITDEVMEGKNSVVFDQAENRMHVQKAIMIKLMGARHG